jgi:MoxR-like ATPase
MADTTDPFVAWMNEAHPDGTATLRELVEHLNQQSESGQDIKPFAKATQAAFEAWSRRDGGLEPKALQSLALSPHSLTSHKAYVGERGEVPSFYVSLAYRVSASGTTPRFAFRITSTTTDVRALILSWSDVDKSLWMTTPLPSGFDRIADKTKGKQSTDIQSTTLGTLDDFIIFLDEARQKINDITRRDGMRLDALLLAEWAKFQNTFWNLFEPSTFTAEEGESMPDPKTTPPPVASHDKAKAVADLARKFKQVILYGPPGTGKTYLAREAAKLLAGDEKRIQLVVFHPAYEYDQFIGGLVPKNDGGQTTFESERGVFVEFADRAREAFEANKNDPDNLVLLIDEINRGNLPKLLGELLYGLEYRDKPVRLSYRKGAEFSVPPNLYILATMNSADKSIGLIDVAVRRRFAFHRVLPNKGVILSEWAKKNENLLGEELAALAESINEDIRKTGEKGRDPFGEMGIGHSYFLPQPDAFTKREDFSDIWRCKLQPLLVEYFEHGWLSVRPLSVDEIPDLKSKDSWKRESANAVSAKPNSPTALAGNPGS